MIYEHLNNHRGEILRPGTLIKILCDLSFPAREGSIFRIIKHIKKDRYSFEIVRDTSEEKNWRFDWEFNYEPDCTIIKTGGKRVIESDPEYEGLFI